MQTQTKPPEQTEHNDEVVALSNQTQFSAEEPLFEEPPSFVEEKDPALVAAEQKKNARTKKILFIAAAIFIGLIVISVFLMKPQQRRRLLTGKTAETSAQTQARTDELKKRLDEVNQDFQAADPSKSDLPIPPVEMNIYIDQPAASF